MKMTSVDSSQNRSDTDSQAFDDKLSSWDDATWILTSTFIIFTMQSGFGLLESGSCSRKNESNIMVKNIVDVVFGGLSYWMVGYGLSFGENDVYGLFATGDFFVTTMDSELIGYKYSKFFFHASFASTATTIVSGAMAERANFNAYVVFSFVNTIIYALPAHWIWHEDGWLYKLGAVDYAGSGAVHLVGGVTAAVAAHLLGPRTGRFEDETKAKFEQMGNPINAVLGLFMLWWGWLGFNCGSTYGVAGGKWKLAAKSAVTTINSSIAAGAVSFLVSFILKRSYDISYITNGILGGLVSITALCPLVSPAESLAVGAVGALLVISGMELVKLCKIDDPVGATAVHGLGGLWSLIAVGLFCARDPTEEQLVNKNGLFHGGGFALLGIQAVYAVSCVVWTVITTAACLLSLKLVLGIRANITTEVFGADLTEHAINGRFNPKTQELFDAEGNLFTTIPKHADYDQLESIHRDFVLHNWTVVFHMKNKISSSSLKNNTGQNLSSSDLNLTNGHNNGLATHITMGNGEYPLATPVAASEHSISTQSFPLKTLESCSPTLKYVRRFDPDDPQHVTANFGTPLGQF